jgi:geranylgeranyl diphosphate synthase type II
MHSISYLQEKFDKAMVIGEIDNRPPELYDPIKYILSIGGKRLRPTILLMACDLLGGDIEEAMPAAMAIEMFHNFTLVHDDIMDKAPIRRGKETVYKKWNTNIAILAGDTMMPLAYDFLLRIREDKMKEVMQVFNQTAKEVCEGQQFDLNFESSDNVSIGQYIEMIRLKTAVLIGGSLKIGGIVAGTTRKNLELLYEFGINTGLAFQLKDDLLDVYGDEQVFGKKNNGDIVANKKTFLYLKALELADDDDRKKLRYYFSRVFEDNDEKVRSVKEIYDKLNIDKVTESLIDKYYGIAIACLQAIDVNDNARNELESIARNLVDRDH